jgi:hypothetical protein
MAQKAAGPSDRGCWPVINPQIIIASVAPLDPALISIADAALYTSESEWTVKERLRQGVYRAKKSGRRTLVILDSVKAYVASLPDAKFRAGRQPKRVPA